MKKYKLNTEDQKKLPSEKVILKHKNFNDLRMQYNEVTKRPKQPLYKNKRMFLLLVLIAVTAYAIYISSNEKENDKGKSVPQTQKSK